MERISGVEAGPPAKQGKAIPSSDMWCRAVLRGQEGTVKPALRLRTTAKTARMTPFRAWRSARTSAPRTPPGSRKATRHMRSAGI